MQWEYYFPQSHLFDHLRYRQWHVVMRDTRGHLILQFILCVSIKGIQTSRDKIPTEVSLLKTRKCDNKQWLLVITALDSSPVSHSGNELVIREVEFSLMQEVISLLLKTEFQVSVRQCKDLFSSGCAPCKGKEGQITVSLITQTVAQSLSDGCVICECVCKYLLDKMQLDRKKKPLPLKTHLLCRGILRRNRHLACLITFRT